MLRVEVTNGSARSRSRACSRLGDVGGPQVYQGVGLAGDRVRPDDRRVPLRAAAASWAGVVRPVQYSSTNASVVQPDRRRVDRGR